MYNDLISIIVPVYNSEKTLERCVESILKQTYKNIEVILVNDGSTDNSLKIANKLADKDNRVYVITKDNGGVSSARNIGIKKSKGKYIGFVDADDWIGEEMYTSMYSNLLENNAEIVLCNYTQVYGEKFIKRDEFYFIDETKINLKESLLTHIISRRENNIMGTCWRMLIAKSILVENEIEFDLGVRMSEDMMFMIKCIDKAKVISLDRYDEYFYWMNQSSITANYMPNIWEDMMVLINWCKKHLSNKYLNINLDYYLDECISSAVIVAISNSCKSNTPKSFFERLKESRELVTIPFVKKAIMKTWKNKKSFPIQYWPQIICIAMKQRWIVVLYHSLKYRTILK